MSEIIKLEVVSSVPQKNLIGGKDWGVVAREVIETGMPDRPYQLGTAYTLEFPFNADLTQALRKHNRITARRPKPGRLYSAIILNNPANNSLAVCYAGVRPVVSPT